LDNKWFIFKISFQNVCTIIPFLTCFLTGYLKPIVPVFYHVPALEQMFYNLTNLPNLLIIFLALWMWLKLPHFQLHASLDVCAHIPSTLWVSISYIMPMAMNTLGPMVQFTTFLLPLCKMLFSCGIKTITCVFFNDVQFLLLMSWHCAHKICTLVDIVIIDPACAIFFFWSCKTQRFATSNVAQAKERSYHDQQLTDQFFRVTIEVFRRLHKHAYVFFHDCADAIWSLKRLEGPSLFYLGYFSSSKNFNYITMDFPSS
jgi:hypothetical protein